ncbi:hypothetical protein T12_3437 [Trichinella patagoniensis]|uniref:Uncharacterized protein n=1 Tax=Trichinella patagoniensis TaxID=990121 RepID=A0A0V0YTU9_9BILA|nr:hypothetical protein T12_3437 [Trichinella patagoniensis]
MLFESETFLEGIDQHRKIRNVFVNISSNTRLYNV